jgi:tetratricopeptide (TPR) repeat protein
MNWRILSNSISRFGLVVAGLLLLPSMVLANAAQYVQWGNQMLAQRQYDKAIQYFSGAAKEDPRNAAAYKGLGYAYAYKGDRAKAAQYLQYSLQLNPNDAQLKAYAQQLGVPAGAGAAAGGAGGAGATAYQNGVRYLQGKQYPYAAYYFNQATQAEPNNAKYWQGLGNAFYGQGSKEKAVAAWEKAVALDPSNTQLAGYVASLKGSGSGGNTASAGAEADETKGMNPWFMGGTVATLGAIMLFVF